MENIVRRYRDEKIRSFLDKIDFIAYHVRMDNSNINKGINIDTNDVWSMMPEHRNML